MCEEFIAAVRIHQWAFGLSLSNQHISRLADYYEIVQAHNPILHLVAPCSAEEFAIRHVLESLTLMEFLPQKACIADVGAGAGLPSIPCLIVRQDLRGVLIESKEKKAKFLETSISALGLQRSATVVNRQFEEVTDIDFSHVTCRALDKFTEKLRRLIRWAKDKPLQLFGGDNLREELDGLEVKFAERLLPLSERRYLFIANERRGKILISTDDIS